MRYNKGDIQDTVRVARLGAKKNNCNYYILATYFGFTMTLDKPTFVSQRYLTVKPSGEVEEYKPVYAEA